MNAAAGTSSVADLMASLTAHGIPNEFTNTGGGCMAIQVDLPHSHGYLLITDTEGPLSAAALDSDEDRTGWWVGAYGADGYSRQGLPDGDPALYEGADLDDLDAVVAAVKADWDGHQAPAPLTWVVVTQHADGTVTDVELLDEAPRWDGSDLPVGTTQLVRAGHINGGDTSHEATIHGTRAGD